MAITRGNKTTRADAIRKVQAGLTKHYANVNLTIAGTSYKPAALQTVLQDDVDANDASTNARAAWLESVTEARSADQAANTVLRGIKAQVTAQYGDAPNAASVFADFGWTPRKKVTRTADAKAAAVAQSKATREARGTKGPKAKLKIRGTVTTTVPSNGGSAAAPSPASTATTPDTGSSTSASSPSASPNVSPTTPAVPAAPANGASTSHT
jgi:hypothetical protein